MANLRLDNGTRIVLYRMSKRARRLQTDEVWKCSTTKYTLDIQCSDDSGDDDLMMVGSDDEFRWKVLRP